MIHHRNRKGKTANSKKIRRFPYIKTKKKEGIPRLTSIRSFPFLLQKTENPAQIGAVDSFLPERLIPPFHRIHKNNKQNKQKNPPPHNTKTPLYHSPKKFAPRTFFAKLFIRQKSLFHYNLSKRGEKNRRKSADFRLAGRKTMIQQDYLIIMIGPHWQNLKKIFVKTRRKAIFWKNRPAGPRFPPPTCSAPSKFRPCGLGANPPANEKTLLRRKRGVEKPAQKGRKRINL